MLRMLTRFNSFMLGILVVAAAANAQTTQNGLTAKAGTAPVNNVAETHRSRARRAGPARVARGWVGVLVVGCSADYRCEGDCINGWFLHVVGRNDGKNTFSDVFLAL